MSVYRRLWRRGVRGGSAQPILKDASTVANTIAWDWRNNNRAIKASIHPGVAHRCYGGAVSELECQIEGLSSSTGCRC